MQPEPSQRHRAVQLWCTAPRVPPNGTDFRRIVQEGLCRNGTAHHVGESLPLMADGASGLVPEETLATRGCGPIEAVSGRLWLFQTQLIVQQGGQPRRDEVRRLCDEEPD